MWSWIIGAVVAGVIVYTLIGLSRLNVSLKAIHNEIETMSQGNPHDRRFLSIKRTGRESVETFGKKGFLTIVILLLVFGWPWFSENVKSYKRNAL